MSKKNKQISQETATKYQLFLTELKQQILKNNGVFDNVELRKICHILSVPYMAFKVCINLGFFTKLSKKKYLVNYAKITPVQLQNLILNIRKHHRKICRKSRRKKATQVNKTKLIKWGPVKKAKLTSFQLTKQPTKSKNKTQLATQNQQWFIKRIGKTIYRHTFHCNCPSCSAGFLHGITVLDEAHAIYLSQCSAEMGLKYSDNKLPI